LTFFTTGNPTGNVLSYNDLADIARICAEEGLVIFSDEVYQPNVYNEPGHSDPLSFVSMKKVIRDLDIDVELVSFHSTSKGFIGECGRRGGFMELCGFDSEVKDQIMKLASSALCPNTNGQVMTDLMVRPPDLGTNEHSTFTEERDGILNGLQRKSSALGKALNSVEGMSCQPLQGAMYAFPKIEMSAKAVAAANAQGQTPCTYYALSLLRRTGICTVPGSGFGQEDGTYHLRLTFLPEEDKLLAASESIKEHHVWFSQQHADDA
jgi:alanine transaminase